MSGCLICQYFQLGELLTGNILLGFHFSYNAWNVYTHILGWHIICSYHIWGLAQYLKPANCTFAFHTSSCSTDESSKSPSELHQKSHLNVLSDSNFGAAAMDTRYYEGLRSVNFKDFIQKHSQTASQSLQNSNQSLILHRINNSGIPNHNYLLQAWLSTESFHLHRKWNHSP